MQKTALCGLIILLALTACAPSPTGLAVSQNTTNETKPVKYTIPDKPINATQTCKEQIDDLKEQKVKDEYNLLQVDGDKQKISMELQFKKDNNKFEKEIEGLTKKLQDVSKQSKDLKADISAKKDAIRLLEEKCNLKK